jgi:hypothetical protein
MTSKASKIGWGIVLTVFLVASIGAAAASCESGCPVCPPHINPVCPPHINPVCPPHINPVCPPHINPVCPPHINPCGPCEGTPD